MVYILDFGTEFLFVSLILKLFCIFRYIYKMLYLVAPRVPSEVVRGRVLRRGGARPAVALVIGRRPARAELGQLRALARLPRPHAGGHDAF